MSDDCKVCGSWGRPYAWVSYGIYRLTYEPLCFHCRRWAYRLLNAYE